MVMVTVAVPELAKPTAKKVTLLLPPGTFTVRLGVGFAPVESVVSSRRPALLDVIVATVPPVGAAAAKFALHCTKEL
jgi:hypothetical protein